MAQYQTFQDVQVKIYDTDNFESVQKKFNSVSERAGKEVSGYETMQAHIEAFGKLNNRDYWFNVDPIAREEAEKMCGFYLFGDNFGKPLEVKTEETVETSKKTKRVPTPKSPLFELLPQVFKGNGKVRKHPFNAKAKTSDVREIIRNAAKISMMTSVIIVLPAGTLQLSQEFKNLCVNSLGTSTFDLILEEMMMMGWTIRGVNLNAENSIDIA